MCVAFGSITHKKSDMSEKFIKTSVDSYGTFLIKNALEPPRKVSYDDLLTEIGEFGWWQQWQIFLYSLPPFMSGALFMLGTFTSNFPLISTELGILILKNLSVGKRGLQMYPKRLSIQEYRDADHK